MIFRSALLALILLSVSCTETPTTPEIRIGFLPTIEGEFEASGQAGIAAAELAVQQINEKGGLVIGGRAHSVVLVTREIPLVPEAVMRTTQELINHEDIVALVGSSLSTIAIPSAGLANRARIPMISPGASHPAVTQDRPFIFTAVVVDSVQGQAMAQFAYGDRGARRAAVLYDISQQYNRGIAEVFRDAFEARGGQVVAFEAYTTGMENFTAPLERILQTAPDVLYLPNYPQDVPRQVEQARQMGIASTLLGSGSWGLIPLEGQSTFDGAYHTTNWIIDIDSQASHDFVAAFRETHGVTPVSFAALTYDAFGLLFQVIQKQGSTDPVRIRDGLNALDAYEGVTGTISYQGRGNPQKNIMIVQIQDSQRHFHQWIDSATP